MYVTNKAHLSLIIYNITIILVNEAPHFSLFSLEWVKNVILSLLLGNPQSICFLTASCDRKHYIFKHYASLKFHFHHVKQVNVVFTCNNHNMSLPYGTNPVSASVTLCDKTSIRRLVAFRGKISLTLSNNNIKCGKLFIGYSKMNCIRNYTTTGKYCKLINCLA